MTEYDHSRISPTAWGIAWRRTFAGIPLSNEIYLHLDRIVIDAEQRKKSVDVFSMPELTPIFEARYKLTSMLLFAEGYTQTVELAAGFSPRGMSFTINQHFRYIEVDLPAIALIKRRMF